MMNNVASADVYTDFDGLAKLKLEAKHKTPEAIAEVARQFESVFLSMVLKGMRAAKLTEGGIMDNDQSQFYQDMHDQQLSIHLAGKPGIGLADLIAEQLSPQKNNSFNPLGLKEYQNRPITTVETKQLDAQEISSKEDFVRQLSGIARQAAEDIGVDARVLLAQAALETGWGKSVIKMTDGSSSFNLFNIKTHHNWSGKQATINTLEFDGGVARQEKSKFRAYANFADSFTDYVQFIKQNPRYQQALKNSDKAESYLRELQAAGYATDPAYADKVMRVYHDDVFAELAKSAVKVAQTEE